MKEFTASMDFDARLIYIKDKLWDAINKLQYARGIAAKDHSNIVDSTFIMRNMTKQLDDILNGLKLQRDREQMESFNEEKMIAYGATCVWWDDKEKVDILGSGLGSGLPCCPHCKGVLCEMPEMEWASSVEDRDKEDPGYKSVIYWGRGKCFRTYYDLLQAYKNEIRDLINEENTNG